MSTLAFVTHPSVRIKGTENTYAPVQCLDDLCCNKNPHLHCPFCVKSDSYTDPVILKAHYRVKHVDKGIEFAGLKILRCCDHCDIVGVIKGEKKFKGAHWHCYRCRNGFNRRDEAIKHYKTHFRNPQTTFQISITQDLNTPVPYSTDSRNNSQAAVKFESGQTDHLVNTDMIHPALTEAVSCLSTPLSVSEQDITTSSESLTNGKVPDGAVQVSVAASDVVEEEEQAIVINIIQEEELESSEIESSYPTHIISSESVTVVNDKGEDDKGSSLQQRVQRLEQEKDILKAEISQLHKQIDKQEENLMASRRREEELAARLANASDRGIAELLKRMESEHHRLLRQQLDTLHQVVMASRSPPSAVLQLTDQHGQEIQVVNASSLEAFLAGNMTTATTISDGQTTLPSTTIIQASDLSLEQVSASEATAIVTTSEVPVSSADIELGSNYVMCVQNMKTEREDDDENTVTVDVSSEDIQTVNETGSLGPPSKRQKVN
ncbi:uncharacterized protein [Littorina saxatilis]|uniref:uncharacterized protein n=1 Tax=Littorina saxatilis TaxID=31220 RepID=UPI0038B4F77C